MGTCVYFGGRSSSATVALPRYHSFSLQTQSDRAGRVDQAPYPRMICTSSPFTVADARLCLLDLPTRKRLSVAKCGMFVVARRWFYDFKMLFQCLDIRQGISAKESQASKRVNGQLHLTNCASIMSSSRRFTQYHDQYMYTVLLLKSS